MISFIKTTDPGLGEIDLIKEINTKISTNNKVLWILSGGSNIAIETTIMSNINQEYAHNLKIILGDERYGLKNHKDSNEKQLEDQGFATGNAEFFPILIEKSVDETVSNFSINIDKLTTWADYIIGQLGIGDDGHTSGVLPNSSGVDDPHNVVSYRGPDFHRITMTLHSIERINQVYVFSFGKSKHNALLKLKDKADNINNLPSLVFYKIPYVYVYNDYIGDKQ